MYQGIIVYKNGDIEEVEISGNDFLKAMQNLHKICNARINLGHETITQVLLTIKH